MLPVTIIKIYIKIYICCTDGTINLLLHKQDTCFAFLK